MTIDDIVEAKQVLTRSAQYGPPVMDIGMLAVKGMNPKLYQSLHTNGVTDDRWVRFTRLADGSVSVTLVDVE